MMWQVGAVLGALVGAVGGFEVHPMGPSDIKTIVDRHNALRAQYGACPLEWDNALAEAVKQSEQMKQCVGGKIADGETSISELYQVGDPITFPTLLDLMANEQVDYDALPAPLTTENEDVRIFTQMIWQDSLKIGCASCYHILDFGNFVYLNCFYSAKGNIDSEFTKQLGAKGSTCDKCRNVKCVEYADHECMETGTCDPVTGRCSDKMKADGAACKDDSDADGTCQGGVCKIRMPCDGVVCVAKSQCHRKGTCNPVTGICDDPLAAQPGVEVLCDDGNALTVNDKCQTDGTCQGENLCAMNTCQEETSECKNPKVCDPMTGNCVETSNKPDDTDCDDGIANTVEDKCNAGKCMGVDKCKDVTCNLADHMSKPCINRVGKCDRNTGSCSFDNKPDGIACDDGDINTTNEKCDNGMCVGEKLCENVKCTPKDECHVSNCNPSTGKCEETRKMNPGDGGGFAPCKTCTGKVCVADPNVKCRKQPACNPKKGECEAEMEADGTPCDDDNDVTVGDVCAAGVCKGKDLCANVTCKMLECHEQGTCDSKTGRCVNPVKTDGAPCDDGEATTVKDMCTAGVCKGEPKCDASQCPASRACMMAACDANNKCTEVKKPNDTPCDDGNADTQNDVCTDGTCVGTDLCASVTCTASECFVSTCDKMTGLCVASHNDNVTCDDNNPITVNDTCSGGRCVGIDRQLCKAGCTPPSDCHLAGECDPLTGDCSVVLKDDGVACNSTDPLTKNHTCNAGKCEGVPLCTDVVCGQPNDCHAPGKCNDQTGRCEEQPLPDDTPCDDGDAMTVDDACMQGTCVGQDLCKDVDCSDYINQCNTATCDYLTGKCVQTMKQDGIICDSTGSMCNNGNCTNLCWGVSCSAESQCHEIGTCNPMDGLCSVVPKNDTEPCDDGNIRTADDMCDGAGVCVPGRDVCDMVTCEQPDANSCYATSVCDPVLAPPGELCTRPIKKDGTQCDDGMNHTFNDMCKAGQCVGSTCLITMMPGDGCEFGTSGVLQGGGFGWTPAGNIYVDGTCQGKFLVEATGEEGEVTSLGRYQEIMLKQRMTLKECLPTVAPCKEVCKALGPCYEVGVCDPVTGLCSNPMLPDGSECDDGNPKSINDKCEAGVCRGTMRPPGCYKASIWSPSQECAHDDAACGHGSNVWNTMEECCRPGNAHKNGCKPAPPTTGKPECWRAGKWWPVRDCVKDETACDWGMGTHVWSTRDECCEAGNGFECGCNKPPVSKQCWTDSKGNPERSCIKVEVSMTEGQKCGDVVDPKKRVMFDDEKKCCASLPFGCTMPCKTLDVVLVLDGSGSMKQSFTSHKHGFYALIEMLKDWINDMPLTGELSGDAKNVGFNGGVRIGLVQFSGSRYREPLAIKAPSNYKGTTRGRLSGNKHELVQDVEWHRRNFIGKGTRVAKGLQLASGMFEDIARPRAVIILTDGEIQDSDSLSAERRKLDQKDVVVFGVVVRRSYYRTPADNRAESLLKPILSQPRDDHFFNIEIDEIPEKVLFGVCDPNSKWGAFIKPVKDKVPAGVPQIAGKFNPVRPSATGHANVFFKDTPVRPFIDLDCSALFAKDTCGGASACDSVIDGASVTIDGVDNANDMLTCPDCLKNDVRAEYMATTGILVLSGEATVRTYTKLLASVTFTTKADSCEKRTFTYAYSQGFCTAIAKGHIYQYFQEPGIRWDKAQEKCASKKVLGMSGYLITITSREEELIAQSKLGGRGWMGASDAGIEGSWRWVTGPEGCPPEAGCDLGLARWVADGKGSAANKKQGTLFYTEGQQGNQGYSSWGPTFGKPVCWCRPEQDFGYFSWPSGKWNDFPIDHRYIDGYVCEWGGQEKPCLSDHVGTRVFECATGKPPVQAKCAPKPPVPVGKTGCASGWVGVDGSTSDWCQSNCLDDNNKLKAECRPGKDEKCKCLPEQVKQCRCSDTSLMTDAYCADIKPLDSGLHTCSMPSQAVAGDWTETALAYTGLPPASGDGDAAYKCHRYEAANKTWAAVEDGQCRDKKWQYFAQYVKAELDIEQCKDLCTKTEGCHAVHWGLSTAPEPVPMCHLNAMPVGQCGAGKRLCQAKKTTPPGVKKCGCHIYRGAKPEDTRTCVQAMAGGKVNICSRPDANGECQGTAVLCSRRPIGTLTFKATVTTVTTASLHVKISTASGVSTHSVSVSHVCKASVCAGKCPGSVSALKSKGCVVVSRKSSSFKKSGRGAAVLEDDSEELPGGEQMVAFFDIDGTDEERSAAMERVSANVEKVKAAEKDPMLKSLFEKDEGYKALQDLGAEETGRSHPAAEDVVDTTDRSGGDDSDDSSGVNGGMIAGIVLGTMFIAAGGFFAYTRKQKVRWGDVAVKQEIADTSSPKLPYNELQEMGMHPVQADRGSKASTPVETLL